MNKIFIVDLESVPSRYTYYWKSFLPRIISMNTSKEVFNISGGDESIEATKGAFLNFSLTNVYKANQVSKISKYINEGFISDGDAILFADAWNPSILNIKYMIDLLGLDVKMHGIWHAGSYDPNDFLGRLIKDKSWSYAAEDSFFHALDVNYYATDYHIELAGRKGSTKAIKTGLPMEYISTLVKDYLPVENLIKRKRKLVCFPHRIAPEKSPEFFKEVMSYLPEYDYILCQEHNLSKEEYYDTLAESSIVFSANKQETLGIGTFEGMMFGAKPVVPNNLSYKEMYRGIYKYNPCMVDNNPERVADIIKMVDKSVDTRTCVNDSKEILDNFFTGSNMYECLERSHS